MKALLLSYALALATCSRAEPPPEPPVIVTDASPFSGMDASASPCARACAVLIAQCGAHENCESSCELIKEHHLGGFDPQCVLDATSGAGACKCRTSP